MSTATLQAVIALTQLVSVINEAANTANRIGATIQKARDEDRDLTDDELAVIKAETDAKHDEVMALLRRASQS